MYIQQYGSFHNWEVCHRTGPCMSLAHHSSFGGSTQLIKNISCYMLQNESFIFQTLTLPLYPECCHTNCFVYARATTTPQIIRAPNEWFIICILRWEFIKEKKEDLKTCFIFLGR